MKNLSQKNGLYDALTAWKEKQRGKNGKTEGYCTSRKYKIWTPEIPSDAERIDRQLQYGFIGRKYGDRIVTAKRLANERRVW